MIDSCVSHSHLDVEGSSLTSVEQDDISLSCRRQWLDSSSRRHLSLTSLQVGMVNLTLQTQYITCVHRWISIFDERTS